MTGIVSMTGNVYMVFANVAYIRATGSKRRWTAYAEDFAGGRPTFDLLRPGDPVEFEPASRRHNGRMALNVRLVSVPTPARIERSSPRRTPSP